MAPKVTAVDMTSPVYPFMKEGSRPALFETHLTAQKLGISHREKIEKPANSKFASVFSAKKILAGTRFAGSLHGVVRIASEITNFIIRAFSSIKTAGSAAARFARFKGTTNIPFWGIEAALGIYDGYQGSKAAYKAKKIGDLEGVRHNSLAAVGFVTGWASSGMALVGIISEFKNVAIPVVTSITLASIALGVISFGIYTIYQAAQAKRLCTAASRFNAAFNNEKKAAEKYQAGLNELRRQIEISPEEYEKAVKRAYSRNTAIREEIANVLQKKFNKLERRVGKEIALEIEENLDSITHEIDHADLKVRKAAFGKAEALMKKYRGAVNRELTLRVMQVAAGVLGAVGVAMFVVNPVAASLLIGIGGVVGIIAWYGNKYWKIEKFENRNILGIYNNYHIPTAAEALASKVVTIKDKKSRDKAAERIEKICKESIEKLDADQKLYAESAA